MYRNIVLGFLILVFLAGCGARHRYNMLVEKELASGIRHDSLFLGITFGMSKKEFYSHCWKLNKQGLIRQGPGNATVLYVFNDLKEPAEMNFYPKFFKGSIWKMPVKYSYQAWAPWNTSLCSDSLVSDLVSDFEKIYGKKFIEVNSPRAGKIYYTIDGNRKISVYKGNNEKDAWAIFTDLTVESEANRNTGKKTEDNIKGADSL